MFIGTNTLYIQCTCIKEWDLTKRFCSAGSKDGCIKLWKISKNYTVLQPLYSIPMVGRFQGSYCDVISVHGGPMFMAFVSNP